MKKIALSMVFCASVLFFSCKKDKDSTPTTPAPQTNVVLINLSDSSSYSVINEYLPSTPLMAPGGTVKKFTISPQQTFFILFAKQAEVDTEYFSAPLVENTENVFFMYDGIKAQIAGEVTGCYTPPADKSIIRYVNLDTYQKMEIVDGSNAVSASFNKQKLPNRPVFDTTAKTDNSVCSTVTGGKYTINIYDDGNTSTPAYTKTNVQIDKNKVYYIYLDGKKDIKMIER